MMSLSKRCYSCKRDRFFSEFHKNKSNKDGLAQECKSCRKEITKDQLQKRRERNAKSPPRITKKKCSNCRRVKKIHLFSKNITSADGYNYLCKSCYNKVRPRQNKEVLKEYALKTRFNLSLIQYYELLELQEYKCAICRKNSNKSLAVDHCHKTGKVRGLLCFKCNSAIGLLNENIDNLERAMDYLKENGVTFISL